MMMRLWFNGHGRLPVVAGRGTRRVVVSGIDALAGPDASGPVAPGKVWHSRSWANKFAHATRRMAVAHVFVVLAVLFSGVSSVFGDGGRGAAVVDFVEITPASARAVEQGLAYLVTKQEEAGNFAGSIYKRHVGITALACMAFMSDGHLPGRGEYGPVVEKGLDFILAHCQETGLIAAEVSHGPMYGHGFATLFLGEIYGMTGDPRVRDALVKAVRLIVATQNHEGGWRYNPVPFDADLSVTICQIMALRSARNAGISVPEQTIDKAIAYVRQCQEPGDGGFRYMLSSRGSQFPRSAAGVASLYYAGVYDDQALSKGLNYLLKNAHVATNPGGGHYYYGQYYAVQAMYLAGGDYWANWFPRVRDSLVKHQQPDGSWNSSYGGAYGTSMSLIVLQIPNRLLPIFQR